MADPQPPHQQPVLRWPALLHPAPALFLGIPLPAAPAGAAAAALAPTAGGPASSAVADAGALAGVVAALQGADVSYL